MKSLALLALITTLTAGAAYAGDDDWRLRIKKEADGWSASLSGPSHYGSSRHRIRGSGVRVEKQRALPAFSRLRLEGPIDVTLNQAAADQATVIADDNIEPLIETVVEGETLVVRLKREAGFTMRGAPALRLDARNLQAMALHGSGDLRADRFKGDSLNLQVDGSGDMHVGLLELKELHAELGGSGDMRLAGRAEQQTWRVSGSGDVDALALTGRSAKVRLSGSGDVDLGVTEQLDAQLTGSGDLRYAGRPQLRRSVTGTGEILPR